MASLVKRGSIYYLRWRVGGKPKKRSLGTSNYQIAREKQRQFESAQAQGNDNPLPTRTPIGQVLEAYVKHVRAKKTEKSAQTDVYYLREAFGLCCEALTITSRRPSAKTRKKPSRISKLDRRKTLPVIEAHAFELITAAQISDFIDFKVRDQGLKPKTANHYRSIISRVFNWARESHGLRLPGNTNPASQIRPYKERAPEIRFLKLDQIDEQLHALRFKPQLQTMVAVLIYAGLRREELLWLTLDDIDLRRSHGGNGLIRVRAKTIETPAGRRSWQPKTGKNRAVPISSALRPYLDRYTPPATAADAPTPGVGGSQAWYFPSPEGTLWDPDNFSDRHLYKANHEKDLRWSCLDFRHTFGSHLAQNGVSLYKISTLMGNSPEICRRHYASLVPETMTSEVDFVCYPPNATTA
ncbi:MAG: site-specific integrase [Planctomycetota bacterium]